MSVGLFDPWVMGPFTLRNRVVMAPMTRNRAGDDGVPAPYAVDYYRQRAGAGLIVTEATQPSEGGRGYAGTPGIHSDAQEAVWAQVADAVHAEGGLIFCQLMHTGRIGHTSLLPDPWTLVAPSAVPADLAVKTADGVEVPAETPKALTEDEIQGVIEDFASAAERAVRAGLDGIELHGANGYLLHQFLSTGTNLREDRYGGDPERRARFVFEVTSAVADRIGPERVGLRLSPGGKFNDMRGLDDDDTYLALVDQLLPLDIAYLHVLRRRSTPLHEELRRRWRTTFILNTGYFGSSDKEELEEVLASGAADLVSVGRHFVSNPDLVERWRRGIPLTPWDEDTFFEGGPRGLIDYPAAT
jgi:N-ethylmaleimide reductase